jgi:hypothetical protein
MILEWMTDKGGYKMSLKDMIQKTQYGLLAKELQKGNLPEGYSLDKFLAMPDEVLNIQNPVDELRISSNNQHIATFHKEINAWVLDSKISPDTIPSISWKNTISEAQYHAMFTLSEYKRLFSPNYDRSINGIGATSLWEEKYTFSESAKHDYDMLSPEIKLLLNKIDKNPTAQQIASYAKVAGTNVGYSSYDGVTVSAKDVMRCVFGNVSRIKEFEPEYQNQKELKMQATKTSCAIGRYEITPNELEKIKESFDKGELPDDFTLFRYELYDDFGYLKSIPSAPLKDCDTINYKGIPFAEFNGKAWELVAQSKLDGIPPITSDEMWRIFCHVTETATHLMEQKREYQSLDDLLDSVSSDVVNTSNEEHDRDNEVL